MPFEISYFKTNFCQPIKLEIRYNDCFGGLTKYQPLWVILCRLPKKGRKEIEELVEGMKEKDREERTGIKVEKKK